MIETIQKYVSSIVKESVTMYTLFGNAIRSEIRHDSDAKFGTGFALLLLLVIGIFIMTLFPGAATFIVSAVLYLTTLVGGIINVVSWVSNDKIWFSWTREFPALVLAITSATAIWLCVSFIAALPIVILF